MINYSPPNSFDKQIDHTGEDTPLADKIRLTVFDRLPIVIIYLGFRNRAQLQRLVKTTKWGDLPSFIKSGISLA